MSPPERRCSVCNAPISGRIDRKTCSDRCRSALKRAQSRAEAVSAEAAPVAVGAWQAEEPADPLEHWQPIEEEALPWW